MILKSYEKNIQHGNFGAKWTLLKWKSRKTAFSFKMSVIFVGDFSRMSSIHHDLRSFEAILGHFRRVERRTSILSLLEPNFKSGLFEKLNQKIYERCLIKLREAFGNILVFLLAATNAFWAFSTPFYPFLINPSRPNVFLILIEFLIRPMDSAWGPDSGLDRDQMDRTGWRHRSKWD